MKKYLVILLFLATHCASLATETKSDAVFEKITIEYTLNEDGSQEYRYYKRLKLLTHLSFNRLYGETFIIYNPQYQTLKINLAQTTHSDGKITPSPENAFNEVLPYFAAKAPYYNHLREMVVTHTGTESDAVIELDYVIRTNAGFYPGLMADEILTETSPVLNKEIIIKIPYNKELQYKVYNLRTGPEITTENNQQVFRFSFNGLRAETQESHQPGDKLHLPRLIFSTVTWAKALEQMLIQSETVTAPSRERTEMVDNLRSENRHDLPFLLRLNKKVTDEINHYPIPWQYNGFRTRNPDDTWKSNGGTDLEKNLLFSELLKKGGIHAVPAVVIPTALFDEKIGCLTLVRDFLVQVNPRELEQIYLSAVRTPEQNRIFNLTGNTIISLDSRMFIEAIDDTFENKVISSGSFILDDSFKLAGQLEILLTESANPYYQVELDTNSLKSLIGGYAHKEEIKVDLINAAQYRTLANVNLMFKEPLKQLGDYFLLDLPVNMAGTEKWNIRFLHNERFTPFELPNTIDEQYSFSIRLPEGVKLINPAALIEKSAPCGELVIYIAQDKDVVIVKKMLILSQKTIDLEDYPVFKEMMDLWNEKNFRRLYLTKH
jgi:hypothetical protein